MLALCAFNLTALADYNPVAEENLQANREMQLDLLLSLRYLDRGHYNEVDLDDALSEKVFNRYLEILDPNKVYFYEQDIAQFSTEKWNLDNQLKQGNAQFGLEVYKVLRNRIEEREQFAHEILDKGFDFDIDENYVIDRSESAWLKTKAEMDELWRKRVKNSVLIQQLDDIPYAESKESLKKRFTRQKQTVWQTKPEEVFEFYLNALMREVGPHTQYMSRVTAENFRINLSLSLEGIGASLQNENDYTIIRKIIPGGPASKSGKLAINDKIVGVGQSVDSIEDVTGWRLMDVVSQIRGKKGSVVYLNVLSDKSPPGSTPETVAIVRDVISLEDSAAQLEYQTVNDKRFAVIEIPSFYAQRKLKLGNKNIISSTSEDVERLIQEAQSSGKIDGLIIDLRGNGGGYLREAINLTGLFIDDGPVLQVKASNSKAVQLDDNNSGTAYDGPLAVLVDKSSASASEIFAGAIKDYGRGIIIGERTFGKGTVQTTQPLKRVKKGEVSSTLKFTIQQFFRINGESTQVKGVEPHINLNTGDRGDFGEGSLDNALPWTQINAVVESDNPMYIDINNMKDVEKAHLERAEHSAAFTYLQQTAEQRAKNLELNEVSLNLKKRQEMSTQRQDVLIKQLNEYRQSLELSEISFDNIDSAHDDFPNGDKHWDRVFQQEAALILNDFIHQNSQYVEESLVTSTSSDQKLN